MADAAVKDALISMQMDDNENIFTPYPCEAGWYMSFLTGFEDEELRPEHSFLEHDCDKELVDVHLGYGTYSSQKCSTLEYDEIIDTDVVDSTLNIEEETKTEFFDGMLQGTEETMLSSKWTPHIGTPNGHPLNDPCQQSALGENAEPLTLSITESVADTSKVSSENAGLESGKINSSTQFDLMTVKGLQDTFKNMFGRETKVVGKQWLKHRILFGMQDNESNGCLNIMACDTTSPKTSGSESSGKILSSFQGKMDNAVRKRMHKPPRRYIEESLESKSKYTRRRCEISSGNTASKIKYKRVKVKVKQRKQLCDKEGIEESPTLHQEEPLDGACIQVPFGLPLEEEEVNEKTICSTWSIVPCHDSSANCTSNQSSISSNERSDQTECVSAEEDDVSREESDMMGPIQKGEKRRKHNVAWSQSEVMKLIEGVSQMGVGR